MGPVPSSCSLWVPAVPGIRDNFGALLDRTLPWIPSRKRLNRAHRPHPKWALGLITIRQKEKGSLLGALEAKLLGY